MKGCTEKNGNPRDTECYYNAGLAVVLRIGPWCHGEVRYGGFPDYVALMPGTRSNNARYLAALKSIGKSFIIRSGNFATEKRLSAYSWKTNIRATFRISSDCANLRKR